MLTRVAVFEGAIEAGAEDAFFADVQARLEPIWRRFPHVLDVRVLRTQQADPGAIPIVMVLEMDFPDLDAIHASLASDIKTTAHATTLEVLKPFNGRFFHLIAQSRLAGAGLGRDGPALLLRGRRRCLADAAGGLLFAADRRPRTTEQAVTRFELHLEPRVSQDRVVTCRVDEPPVADPPPDSERPPTLLLM